MKKDQLLARWQSLKPFQPVHPEAVPYKHEGSTYGEDGIRISGRPEFVDSVLSRLKDLLAYEGDRTRLQVSYKAVEPRADKADAVKPGAVCCYVQVHHRGPEAVTLNARYGRA